MNLSDQCVLSSYREIATLDEAHNVSIVQHNISKNIYVKKKLSVYNIDIYRYLRDHRIIGIPEIIELVEDDGTLIVIEEYISGRTLRSILDDSGCLPAERALNIIKQLCTILKQMHTADPVIVHRDIKPSNIIVNSDGAIKLIDMNTAKYYAESQSQDTSLLGTAGYAAPEQYGFGASDIRADIYSVGILLNEMLTGENPQEKPVQGYIGEVIHKCTMMDPNDRYGSVDELMNALFGDSISCKQTHPKKRRTLPPGFRSLNPSHMVLAAVGYLSIIGLSFAITTPENPAPINLWGQRIGFILCSLGTILFTCNYLDVWKVFKLDRIKNPFIKALSIFAVDIAFVFMILLIMAIIVNT